MGLEEKEEFILKYMEFEASLEQGVMFNRKTEMRRWLRRRLSSDLHTEPRQTHGAGRTHTQSVYSRNETSPALLTASVKAQNTQNNN